MIPSLSSSFLARSFQTGLFSLLLLLGSFSAQAQTNTWTGGSTDWNTASNWSLTLVPDATHNVVIPSGPTNQPILSTTAVAKSMIVSNGASLTITGVGSLTINGSFETNGFKNAIYTEGPILNDGKLYIGTTATDANYGIWNLSLFTNNGELSINNTSGIGLYLYGGTFANTGRLVIGDVALTAQDGIQNNGGTLINNTTGEITINRPWANGIWNLAGSCQNAGRIIVGAIAGSGSGILSYAPFTNTGEIRVDRCNNGVVSTSNFANTGQIIIGASASLSNQGVVSTGASATFVNSGAGTISINRTSGAGLANQTGSTFTNSATIVIGTSVSGTAIVNQSGATFDNQGGGCPALIQTLIQSLGNGVITDLGSFSNTGTIIESSNRTSGISFNGGLMQNLNGGSFTVASGNAAVSGTGLVWQGCVSRDWNTPANWASGTVPTAANDVLIPADPANQPIISTTAVAKSVEMLTGASLSINSAGGLTINGNKPVTVILGGTTSGFNCSFLNKGTVTNEGAWIIDNPSGFGTGIYNLGTINNRLGGSISLSRISANITNESGASFINSATITFGSSGFGTSLAIRNLSGATFVNQGGGCQALGQALIRILSTGTISDAGSFSNTGGTIIESSTGTSGIAFNSGLVQNLNGGTFNITTDLGVLTTGTGLLWCGSVSRDWNTAANWSGGYVPTATDDVVIPFDPANQPIISTTATARAVEVFSGASLSITSAGSLTINEEKRVFVVPTGSSGSYQTTGFYNKGTVLNEGALLIGNTGNRASAGLYNSGTFSNNGGYITIDNGSSGLHNLSGSFVNSGTLICGGIAFVGNNGLQNEAAFSNTTGALIILEQAFGGLANYASGTFVNSSTITIGISTSISNQGISNSGSFTNTTGGYIAIDRSRTGLINISAFGSPGIFVNSAIITLGTSVSGTAIGNSVGATFTNQGCAALLQGLGNGIISNAGSFSNTGTILENASGNSNISFNGGLIVNNNGGSFTVASGNAAVSAGAGLVWQGCVSTDWNTAGNWYPATVPTATDDAIIQLSVVNQPIISTTATAKSVEVQTGASLSISSAGSLTINGSTGNALTNAGNLTNEGNLLIGSSASVTVTGVGLLNAGLFQNQPGGQITINRTGADGISSTGTFINSATLTIGNIAFAGLNNISNFGSFTNNATGEIRVDGGTGNGIWNRTVSTFLNDGKIFVGSGASTTMGVGILCDGVSFTNNAGASIQLDRVSRGLTNVKLFYNAGQIRMGNNVPLRERGFLNGNGSGTVAAVFNNLPGGLLQIDQTAAGQDGITNEVMTTFTNAGTVSIGTSGSIGGNAITNAGTVTNLSCAVIRAFAPVYNENGTFTNNGFLTVNTLRKPSKTVVQVNSPSGIARSYTFAAAGYGQPISTVNLTADAVLVNDGTANPTQGCFSLASGSLTGKIALVDRGTCASNVKVYNAQQAGAIAVIMLSDVAGPPPGMGGGVFASLITIPAMSMTQADGAAIKAALMSGSVNITITQEEVISTTLVTNNGVITYPQGNPIPNVTNNDLIVSSFSLCGTSSTTALQIGGSNSFSVGTTWYTDAALTTAGGTYNAGTNTFTPTSLSVGTHTLYFTATDNVNNCVQTVSASVTVNATPTRLYVNASQTALTGNGLSWPTAFSSLQQALTYPCSQSLTEIWVAGGTYKPTSTTSRTVSFRMLPGVAIYGGLAGTEPNGYDMNLRNFSANPSILSGDIDGVPDVVTGSGSSLTITGNAGNAYHVVFNNNNGLMSSAILDGFTISGGNANSPTPSNDIWGGGMFNNRVSPTLRNVIFSGNSAVFTGGGLYTSNGNLTLTKCQFMNNLADFGGAIQTQGTVSSLTATITMVDCSLTGNRGSSAAGGINHGFSNSQGQLLLDCNRCAFTNNYSFNGSNYGSAGAFFNEQVGFDGRFTNCLFDGNQGLGNDPDEGGGALLVYAGAVTVVNSTFINNRAAAKGGAIRIYLGSGTVNIKNSIFWNNTATTADNDISTNAGGIFSIQNSLLQVASCPTNITCGTGMLYGQDPRFVDLSGSNVRLTACSPAINTGDPATTSATVGSTDLFAQPRFFNAGTVDMGATEYQGESVTSFSVLGSGTVTCASSPTITLSGSQTGVSYQLQRDGVSTGSSLTGTGAALSFGLQSVTGIYLVVATNTASSCTLAMASTATVVSSTALPVATLTASPNATLTCAQTSVTLTASGGVSYTFANAGGTLGTPGSVSTLVVNAPVTYSVTVANANGCTASQSTTVYSNTAVPTLSLGASNSINCAMTTATLSASAGSGLPAGFGSLTYTFTGGSLPGSPSSNSTVTVNQGGSYSVLVTAANGCTVSQSISVVSNTVAPTVTITPGPGLTISSIQTATFTVSGSANSFTWSNGASTTAISVSVAGTYSVTGVNTTNGCSGTASVVLSVTSAAPIITTQPATASSVCEGASVMTSVVVSNSVTGYQWLKGGSPVAGQTGPTLALGNVQVSDAGVYSLSATGPGGSTTSNGFTLTVNPVPTATITFPNSVTVQGTGVPVVRVPSLSPPVVFQAFGGNLYERLIILDRINGYEIRQADSNTTGIFTITRLGLFTLTVTGAGGCKRTVQWIVQGQ